MQAWTVISGICAIIFTALQAANYIIQLKIRNEVAAIRLYIAEARAEDRDEIKEWAEDRFVLRREI